ncbi:DUF7109 family protein [Haloprofundus halophilus]
MADADDRTVGTDDQTVGTNDQTVGTDDQTVGTNDQTVGTDDQTVGTNDQTVGTDDQTVGTNDQTVGTNDQTVEAGDPERRGAADGTFVAVGPAAFPSLPQNAEDLPHILDVPRREVDRRALGEQVRERLAAEADAAIDDGDEARLNRLYDVTYDLDAWAPVETAAVRDRLDAVLQD